MMGVIFSLLTFVSGGQEQYHAALLYQDGTVIHARTDAEVYNAAVWQTYNLNPEMGSCIIYEDFSLDGFCAAEGKDV